ncbi:MAG TPA: hypothetical protein PK178_14415 [Smithellaceae bacterium]|nr:hypothetical protein [Smithellaceae bacterium]
MARKASTSGDDVFRVTFAGRYRLAQIQGLDDAKKHGDCRRLRKLLLKKLGQGWLDGGMPEKEKAGRLWLPCLRKDEVESLFSEVEALKEIRSEIWEAITFWGDDPKKAETKVKSDADAVGKVEAAPPADYTMPTDTQKAVEQQRPAPPVEMTSPRKGSMAAKYIEGLF